MAKKQKNTGPSNPFQNAARKGDLDELRALLQAGEDINQSDDRGDTALLYAVFNCQGEATRWLLEQGANPAQVNHKQCNALHHMARRFKSGDQAYQDLLDLIQAGVPVNAPDQDGNTPLLAEAMREESFNGNKRPREAHLIALIKAGADPFHVNKAGDMASTYLSVEEVGRIEAQWRMQRQVQARAELPQKRTARSRQRA